MAGKGKTPTAQDVQIGATFNYKDSINLLPKQQRRVFNFLNASSEPQSAADIAVALHQCDPRGHIANLRHKGFPIDDIWCLASDGSRYKRYFIRKEVGDECSN